MASKINWKMHFVYIYIYTHTHTHTHTYYTHTHTHTAFTLTKKRKRALKSRNLKKYYYVLTKNNEKIQDTKSVRTAQIIHTHTQSYSEIPRS